MYMLDIINPSYLLTNSDKKIWRETDQSMIYRLVSPYSRFRKTCEPSKTSTWDFGILYTLDPEDRM
jgi:hypothetical protein